MHAPAVVGGGRAVGRGADEWVRELDPPADVEQPGVDRGVGRRHVDAEVAAARWSSSGVAERLGGGGQDEQLRRRAGAARAAARSSLRSCRRPAGCRAGRTRRRAPRRSRRAAARAARAGCRGSRRRSARRRPHRAGRARCRATARARRRRRARGRAAPGARRGRHRRCRCAPRTRSRPRSASEAAGDEAEDLRRRLVEPLRVVDDADQRLLLGHLGEQRQRGEPDQEAIGRRRRRSGRTPSRARRAAAPGSRSRSSIGAQSWCRPLYASSISDSTPAARTTRHPAAPPSRYSKQRGLADPGLAAQDQHPTTARPHLSSSRSRAWPSRRRPRSAVSGAPVDPARTDPSGFCGRTTVPADGAASWLPLCAPAEGNDLPPSRTVGSPAMALDGIIPGTVWPPVCRCSAIRDIRVPSGGPGVSPGRNVRRPSTWAPRSPTRRERAALGMESRGLDFSSG